MTFWLIGLSIFSVVLLLIVGVLAHRVLQFQDLKQRYSCSVNDWSNYRSHRIAKDKELEEWREKSALQQARIDELELGLDGLLDIIRKQAAKLDAKPSIDAEQFEEFLAVVLDAGDDFTASSHAFAKLLDNARSLLEFADQLTGMCKAKLAEFGMDEDGTEVLTIRVPNTPEAFLGGQSGQSYEEARAFWLDRHPDKVKQAGMEWFFQLTSLLFARAWEHNEARKPKKAS